MGIASMYGGVLVDIGWWSSPVIFLRFWAFSKKKSTFFKTSLFKKKIKKKNVRPLRGRIFKKNFKKNNDKSMKITQINDFRPFWAPLGAPENFYTFYSPLASFSFIFRASWISKIWFIFLQKIIGASSRISKKKSK